MDLNAPMNVSDVYSFCRMYRDGDSCTLNDSCYMPCICMTQPGLSLERAWNENHKEKISMYEGACGYFMVKINA